MGGDAVSEVTGASWTCDNRRRSVGLTLSVGAEVAICTLKLGHLGDHKDEVVDFAWSSESGD